MVKKACLLHPLPPSMCDRVALTLLCSLHNCTAVALMLTHEFMKDAMPDQSDDPATLAAVWANPEVRATVRAAATSAVGRAAAQIQTRDSGAATVAAAPAPAPAPATPAPATAACHRCYASTNRQATRHRYTRSTLFMTTALSYTTSTGLSEGLVLCTDPCSSWLGSGPACDGCAGARGAVRCW